MKHLVPLVSTGAKAVLQQFWLPYRGSEVGSRVSGRERVAEAWLLVKDSLQKMSVFCASVLSNQWVR